MRRPRNKSVQAAQTTELTEEQKATQVLVNAEEQRQKACSEEVNAVLQKHGFALNVATKINLVRTNNGG